MTSQKNALRVSVDREHSENVTTGHILIIQKDNPELTCSQEQQQEQITYPYKVHDDECDNNVKETVCDY